MRFFILAFCIVSSLAYTKRCKTSGDCSDSECCVNFPIVASIFPGFCKKLRLEGESCTPLEMKNGVKPDFQYFQCPCRENMQCVQQQKVVIFGHVIKCRPECVVKDGGNVGDGGEIGEPDAQ